MFAASDCFEIGRHAYTTEDYYHTILWMEEAKNRLMKERPPSVALEEVLEYLAFALYKQGNLKRALQVTEQLYKLSMFTFEWTSFRSVCTSFAKNEQQLIVFLRSKQCMYLHN